MSDSNGEYMGRGKGLGMRGRLIFGFIAMAVVPALIIGLLAYNNARRTIEARVHQQLNSIASLKREEIQNWRNLILSDTKLLGVNFLNEEHITVILDRDSDPAQKATFGNFLTENLLSLQQNRVGYKEIYYADREGNIILSTDASRVGQYVGEGGIVGMTLAADQGYAIQDVFLNDGEPEMAFGHVMREVDMETMVALNLVNAVVVIRVDLEESLYPLVQNWPSSGETGDIFLLRDTGGSHVHISPLRFSDMPILDPAGEGIFWAEGAHDLGESLGSEVLALEDYRGVPVLRATRYLPELDWELMVEQDQSEAFAPVRRLTNLWIVLTVIILLGASVLAIVLARNLTNPLQKLMQAARRVEEGDFETQVDMKRGDEFGQLSAAFNSMVDAIAEHSSKIQKNSEELQALVNVSNQFLTSLDVKDTLEGALREALAATSAEAGAALLSSPQSNEISLEAVVGLPQEAVGTRLPLNTLSVPGYVMLHRRPVTSSDIQREDRFKTPPFVHAAGVRSNMAVPMQIGERVIGVLVLDSFVVQEFRSEEIDIAQTIANQTAVALERIKLVSDLSESYDRTLEALVAALDARDKETEGHSQRVVAYTLALAAKLGIPDDEIKDISRGALLHDIGKIGVPDAILHKPAPLTEEEWAIIHKHPEWGQAILKGISFLEMPAEMVLSHHERWDGQGYPEGLIGLQIPIGARLFAVVDAFDAITSNRPYRKAGSYAKARREIEDGRGSQFDPSVVDAFLEFEEEDWEQIRREARGLEPQHMLIDGQGRKGQQSITGQLDALNVIIGSITSSLDSQEVLANTVRAVTDVTQAEAVGVFLFDVDGNRIIYANDVGLPEMLKASFDQKPVDEFANARVVAEGNSVLASDIREVDFFNDIGLDKAQPDWLSYACVPLIGNEEIVGGMLLFSRKPYSFDEQDLALFEKVGRQVGQAIANARLHEKVRYQAITDALTGAYNRHYLEDFLDLEIERCERYGRSLAMIMMDIDHFKECNDRNGHAAGDKALRQVSRLLDLGVRSMDMVARYGGEEFLVVLPETQEQGATEVAERLRALINRHEFPCGNLTASFGVVAYTFDGENGVDADDLIRRADEALFAAKQAGRNRVELWSEEMPAKT